jgi:uncharacterized cupredoxin-like copper-binding protein
MKTVRWFAVLVLGLLAACGPAQPKTTLNVSMTDFSYSPNELLVPAGQEVTLNISNNGAVIHNLIIMKAGTDLAQDFDAEDEANVYWRIEVEPGDSATGLFNAPSSPGEYLIVCSTAGHYVAGMTGKLVVVGP